MARLLSQRVKLTDIQSHVGEVFTINGDFTVFPGQTYSLTSNASVVFYLHLGDQPEYVFQNRGTIHAVANNPTNDARAFVTIENTGVLQNDGTVIVQANSAAGLDSGQYSPDIINNGLWSVTGQFYAYGLVTAEIETHVTNHGRWEVFGDNGPVGMQCNNGGHIVNTGEITVTSTDNGLATCIDIGRFDIGSINNSGHITAVGAYGFAISVGAAIVRQVTTPNIVNSGTITGVYAIVTYVYATPPQSTTEYVLNTGTINGLIDLGLGNDIIENRDGGAINGDVFMYSGDDTIDTRTGIINGFVFLEDGNDQFLGGSYGQLVSGGLGDDSISGGAGQDEFYGEFGIDVLNGGGGNDFLSGGSAPDTIIGGSGKDVIDGGTGADTMIGGSGNDTYTVDATGDVTTETSSTGGYDLVKSSVTRTLGAHLEKLTLTGAGAINGTGNTLANIITGNSAANTLSGLGGADTLNGGGGNDRLIGGLGLDMLTGGIGADKFVFNTAPAAADRDTITDYSVAADTIQILNTAFVGIGGLGVLAATAFHIGAAAIDASDRIIYNAATGRLYFDADGDGAGAKIWFATLSTGLALTNADFLVI